MNISIYCPACARVNIRRKLMEVDENARGEVYPYCKACKRNVKIVLSGHKPDIRAGNY